MYRASGFYGPASFLIQASLRLCDVSLKQIDMHGMYTMLNIVHNT